jgi:acyl carrier protein
MRNKIKEIMKETFDLNEVSDDISQANCPEWDSMHHLNLIISLEEAFNVFFEPDDVTEMTSLDIVESKIQRLLSEKK